MNNLGFQNEPLEDMAAVGRTTARSVRLWVRSRSPGSFVVEWRPQDRRRDVDRAAFTIEPGNATDNTTSLVLPDAGKDASGLAPLTRYDFRITEAGRRRVLAEGCFETAPQTPADTPGRFAVAVMSCHQPFDKKGGVRKTARWILQAAEQCLADHNAKIVFMVGDQMYSDYPKKMSLFDRDYFRRVAPDGRKDILECTSAEVRTLFHARYRHFWAMPEWKRLHTRFPCYPILDDHDLVDNWGSVQEHQEAHWQDFITGARAACFDYQASRVVSGNDNVPESFYFSGAYGHCAYFVMDLRSQRRAGENGRILGRRQKTELQQFLNASGQARVIFLILSVPLLHLPRFLTRMISRIPPPNEDFSDRWASGRHVEDRDWLLQTIHAHQLRHPEQRIVLLSGDIHIGCAHRIRWNDSGPHAYQFISSGFTHKTGWLVSNGSKLLIRTNRHIETTDRTLDAGMELLKGVAHKTQNPCGNLNMGIVEIDTPDPGDRSSIRFLLYNQRKGRPVRVFESPWR